MRTFVVLLLLAVGCSPLWSADLSGRVELYAKGKKKPLNSTEVASAVVYFEPQRSASLTPPAAPVEMATRDKEFVPQVLVITRGTTVRFPNSDPILHNVFSVSPGNKFDLGLYQQGPGKTYTFTQPGLVRVFCNVHYSMIGHILVLDTPHFTQPDGSGAFRLRNLPAGPGTLRVWFDRAQPESVELQLPHPESLTVQLEVSRQRVPAHLNKVGKPYSRGGERYR